MTDSQLGFFGLVAQAAFSNPFSPLRAEADLKLGGATSATPPQERVALMMKEISKHVGELEGDGMADIRRYQGADHEMLRTSLLFDAFHQFIPRIDRHIEAQVKAGDKPVAATFTAELLGLLARWGFEAVEASHALAIFFQLRRGYYFIARSLVGTSPCMLEFKRRLWNNLFTGAIDHHQGVLARCSPHGAIFIDEIGDVGIPVQVKLLQVLQDRAFSPVGGHERLHFHGRVIAATNRPLGELRARGDFRDDFYYRLCSDVITVPTLRQRFAEDPGELEIMLDALVKRLAGNQSPELVRRIHDALMRSPGAAYAWPGNVRELEQAARQILLTGAYHAQASGSPDADPASLAQAMEHGSLDAEQLVAAYCRHLYQRLGTYEAVAKHTRLDRRTVKKHITHGPPLPPEVAGVAH